MARQQHIGVIGSGIAGTMAAHALLRSGHRVTLFERGDALTPTQTSAIVAKGSFQKAGMPFLRPLRRERPGGNDGYQRALPAVVGGLAEFYQAVSLRFAEQDFVEWPVTLAEMEPFYAEAERLMGVGVPHEPVGPITARFMDATRAAGMAAVRHPLAIAMERCAQCRNCNQIPCTFDARFSPARFAARHLSGQPGFALSKGEVLSFVETPAGVRITLANGASADVDGVVLCAGAIDSAAVLMRSGLGGVAAGRNLMLHGLATVQGVFARAISRGRGFEKFFSVFDHYLDAEGVRGIVQQDQLPAIEHLKDKLPGPLYRMVDRAYDHLAKLLVMVADEARAENRVELRANGGLAIVHEFSLRDQQRLDFLGKRAADILRAAGGRFIHVVPNKSIFHACGTCRMGDDPSRSVTASNGRVHGTTRIHVADAATFCSSGGVNPSLTIAANALRIASGIAA